MTPSDIALLCIIPSALLSQVSLTGHPWQILCDNEHSSLKCNYSWNIKGILIIYMSVWINLVKISLLTINWCLLQWQNKKLSLGWKVIIWWHWALRSLVGVQWSIFSDSSTVHNEAIFLSIGTENHKKLSKRTKFARADNFIFIYYKRLQNKMVHLLLPSLLELVFASLLYLQAVNKVCSLWWSYYSF